MTLTKEQCEEMRHMAGPLLAWLNENCHPHCKLIVDSDSVELVECIAREVNPLFIKD